SDYFEVRDRALIAHATQVDPDGPWFACPRDLQAAAWPTEDFELARSVIPTKDIEDDLFAGVRERLGVDA
ncbi:MAG TPA: mycothiol conjugate amidase Mca, partial [Actinomycetes bacterium]|nr:mycothiol conjugate amidase Mca [Actinomycetes bacterium]